MIKSVAWDSNKVGVIFRGLDRQKLGSRTFSRPQWMEKMIH